MSRRGNFKLTHYLVMPEVPAEEIEIPTRQWIDTEYLEAGSRVRISRPKVEQFVAASSLYRLTPCTQADAITQQPRVVDVVFRAERPKELAAVAAVVDDEDLYLSEAEERSGGVAF